MQKKIMRRALKKEEGEIESCGDEKVFEEECTSGGKYANNDYYQEKCDDERTIR